MSSTKGVAEMGVENVEAEEIGIEKGDDGAGELVAEDDINAGGKEDIP